MSYVYERVITVKNHIFRLLRVHVLHLVLYCYLFKIWHLAVEQVLNAASNGRDTSHLLDCKNLDLCLYHYTLYSYFMIIMLRFIVKTQILEFPNYNIRSR